ncbi:putative interferon-induced GTP-binding protein Mx, partial [Tricladium varicosporioides]
IVKSEMKKQHSTILAVVPANVDFKTQEVLSLCQKYDSEGKRTVGIITRPDTADNGQAITCVAIAKGERKDEVSIGHDWHVLRNRSTEELKNDTTVESRDAVEVDFLRQEPWVQLGTENLGVITLRTRLSKILLDAASQEFPKLADKISAKLLEITVESKRLGGDSMTDEQKRDIFYAGTEKLKKRTILYVSGDTLHDTSDHEASHAIHIRSRIVEQSELFRDRILKEGHSYVSQLEPPGINPNADLRTIAKGSRISAMGKLEPSSKTPKMEIQEAKKHLDELRGMELPGTFNPHHINIFFWQQSRNWNQIAMEHIVKTFRHCELYFEHATRMAFAPDPLLSEEPTFGNHEVIAQRVFRLICSDLEIMKGEAKKELGKLEIDRTHKQLNFNPKYMAENRQQRNAGNAKRSIEAVVKDPALQNKDSKGPVPELNPNTLAELQRRHTQDDRTEEEAENFLNAAWLQYKVIERHFMRKLVDITPNDRKIKSEVFQELVEEDRDLEKKKKNLKLRSEILQKCLDVLKGSKNGIS